MINNVRDFLSKRNIDGFVITRPQNIRYISKYTGDDSCLLITEKDKYFITDPRYTEQAQRECPSYNIINWRSYEKNIIAAARSLIEKLKLKSFAFEGDFLSYNLYKELSEGINTEVIPLTGIIEGFRAVKTQEEIYNIRAACQIADRAFDKIIKDIRVGITEKELASKLSHYMVMEGADTKPYGNILISGKRTSLLHGIPSNKTIEYGDFVLMDYGCGFNGYLSDMTRTVCSWGILAKSGIKMLRIYPYQLFIPSFFISTTMLALNLLGDGMRDALDPKLRGTE